MRYDIRGAFAECINGLISQRQIVGFQYKEGERLLHRFSEFCNLHFPSETELTEEVVKKWIENPNEYSNAYQLYRMAAVRNLGIYMRGMGCDAYVLPIEFYPRLDAQRMVHIYTKEELARIFKCADSHSQSKNSPHLHLVLPVIFRLLYCCGLRPKEALNIRIENVDFSKGEIRIEQSKGSKDRIVVMSEDMSALCSKYNDAVESSYPGRKYLFQSSHTGGAYGKTWITKNFRRLLADAGIDTSLFPKPRLYDVRHTFATHCLQRWMEQGEDINSKLLYLSAYMGHRDVVNTAYYIHLLPRKFVEHSNVSTCWYSAIATEVPDED